jgi:hypothetical protein
MVVTAHQHGRVTLADVSLKRRPMKDAERRNKGSARSAKDTRSRQDPLTFRHAGDVEKGAAGL